MFFSLQLSQNWSGFNLAETYPSFVQDALIFHICMNVFGLFVITRKSKLLYQALLFAMICGVLIDLALAAHGLSRFIEQKGAATSSTILMDLFGLSLWPWIYPTMYAAWRELTPIYLMRRVIRDFDRTYEQDLKNATVAVDGERQHSGAGPSQEERVVHIP
ncbi:MAG: hypothetical protein J3R72DRAFT_440004 [Linnemannia gamsii]|nr:MAG: hypothetical protein J3R72DRAFT_440004 [Linnemannia gamsii]